MDVVRQGLSLDGATTGELHPQDGVLRGIDGGAVHFDGSADTGDDRGADVGDGGGPLTVDAADKHHRHQAEDEKIRRHVARAFCFLKKRKIK